MISLLEAYTIKDAENLKYSELTAENKKKYIMVLESIPVSAKSMFLLGEAYENGIFIQKDITKAIYYYKKSNNKDALTRIGFIYYKNKNFSKAIIFLEEAFNKGSLSVINELLLIAIELNDVSRLNKYKKWALENKILINEDVLKNINSIKKIDIEDKLLTKIDNLAIKSIENTEQLEPLFKAMGFTISKIKLSTNTNNMLSIRLKYHDTYDQELAKFLVKDNIIKETIYKLLLRVITINKKLTAYSVDYIDLLLGKNKDIIIYIEKK
jgi:tetratricopeptide (TPR) repeat protein